MRDAWSGPVDLDKVEAALARQIEERTIVGEAGREVLDAVPDMLSELRLARVQLAGWAQVEGDTEYAITPDGVKPDDTAEWVSVEEATARRGEAGVAVWQRHIYRTPWERSEDLPF